MKKILFIIINILLFITIIQKYTHFYSEKQLGGKYSLSQEPNFNLNNFLNGDFQKQYDEYFSDNFGFRSILIKLNNQINFSLFNKINTFGLTLGKEGYIYGKGYIENTVSGKDFIGKKAIDSILSKVKEIQFQLKRDHNIDLIIVYAPSKEFVIPEFIPERYIGTEIGITNTEYFIQKSKEKKLNFIDLNNHLRQLKKTEPYPIFYRKGEHWSYPSMIKSGEHIINYIEKIRGIDMPDISYGNIQESDTSRYFDNDQGDAINLFFESSDEKYYYPELYFNYNDKIKPNVLAIADCYYQHIFRSPIANECFKNGGSLWFYNREKSSKTPGNEQDISTVNKHIEILKQDVIIHMITNQNLENFGFGFFNEIDNLLDESKYQNMMSSKKQLDELKEQEIKAVIDRITANKKWYKKVKVEAKKRKISIDEMLFKSAKHLIKSRN